MRGDKERLAELFEAARALIDHGEPEASIEDVGQEGIDGNDEVCIYCDTWGHTLGCVWYRLKGVVEYIHHVEKGVP